VRICLLSAEIQELIYKTVTDNVIMQFNKTAMNSSLNSTMAMFSPIYADLDSAMRWEHYKMAYSGVDIR